MTFTVQEASQSNLMDLEIADYERTVSNLSATISERDGKITNLTTEIDSLEKRLEAMQNEVGKSESFQLNPNLPGGGGGGGGHYGPPLSFF